MYDVYARPRLQIWTLWRCQYTPRAYGVESSVILWLYHSPYLALLALDAGLKTYIHS
jgi:hypothetical protein